MSHMTDEQIRLFLSDGLRPTELRRILRHLMSRCVSCRARLGRFDATLSGSIEPLGSEQVSVYDRAIDRARAKALDAAPRRLMEEHRIAQLLTTAGKRTLRISELLEILDANLNGWPLVETLIGLSQQARFRETGDMLQLALAADVAACNLDPHRYTSGIIADLQGRALAELGNAYRVNEAYELAEDAFARAGGLLEHGTGDPLAIARLLDLKASLRTAQRRLSEAIELLDTVFQLYEEIGELHLAGRALISKGGSLRHAGKPLEAIDLLRQGMAMLDSNRDPQLVAIGQHTLLDALVDSGDFRAAQRLLLESGLRQKEAPDPINLQRLRWVEAKIHRGLQKHWRAETIFQEVRAAFLQRGLDYDSALVGLELLDVWLQQDRPTEVRELAAEVLKTFEAMNIEREALKAVRFLEEACRREEASAALVQRVVYFLRRLEWEPRLQFAA